MPDLAIKQRLWERLLAHPDELTDLRIIFAEYINVKGKLDEARYKSYRPPPLATQFETYEERETYLKAMQNAQRWRAHVAALQETYDSLCEQLRMMTDDLNPEDLVTFLDELERGHGTYKKP